MIEIEKEEVFDEKKKSIFASLQRPQSHKNNKKGFWSANNKIVNMTEATVNVSIACQNLAFCAFTGLAPIMILHRFNDLLMLSKRLQSDHLILYTAMIFQLSLK